MHRSRTWSTLTAIALAFALVVAGAVTAGAASATVADCKTVTVHIPDRLDSGHHGNWAHLALDRKVDICVTATTGEGDTLSTSYVATFTDAGTLATIPGVALSPRLGLDLAARNGTVSGTATQPFTAPGAAWAGYAGAAPATSTTTGSWVATIYGAPITTGGITAYNWTYTTCSEKWVDASTNNDGMDDAAGDITGKACPIVTEPPTTTTPPATATATATHTTQPPAGSTTTAAATLPGDGTTTATRSPAAVIPVGNNGDSLPVTGSSAPTPLLFAVGLALLVAGIGLLIIVMRRRHEDQAYTPAVDDTVAF